MESLRDQAPSGTAGCAFSIAADKIGPPVDPASLVDTCAVGVISYPGAAGGPARVVRGGTKGRAIRPPVGVIPARLGLATGGQRERGRWWRSYFTTIAGIYH